jgi:hypothetical protein
MTMTHGVTRGEAYRAANIFNDRKHKGRRDWYVGSDELGQGVMTEGRPHRRLDWDEAVAVARERYGMQGAARGEGRYS